MEEEKKLPIPVNVPEQKDFLPGIGGKEIGIIILAVILGIVLIFVINGISGELSTAILSGVIFIVCIVMAVKRDRFNESIIDKVRIVYQFSGKQKKYSYSYYNMYECENRGRKED